MINLTVVEDNVTITVSEVGPTGPAGQGVPVGGTTGQVLTKTSSTNYATTWANNGTGTVTSVGITESSAALNITGSPVTTSGNINIGFAGTSAQYVAGDGSLLTFPTTLDEAKRLVTQVTNRSGALMTKGTIVYINGAQGNLPTIAKSLATSDATSAQTLGFLQTDIANNASGYVVIAGKIENLDTSAITEGAQLYLSSTIAGTYTTTKQYAPAHLVYVGVVVRSHPTQGSIEVKVQNGYELDEIHNVSAQTPSNNDSIFFNTSTQLWENKSINSVLGVTPIGLTSLSGIAPVSYNNTNGQFSMAAANGSVPGYLTTTDWNTFNSKVAPTTTVATTTPLQGGGNLSTNRTLSITKSDISTDGYLSSTDWNTFNNKANSSIQITAISPLTGGGDLSSNIIIGIPAVSSFTDGYITASDYVDFKNRIKQLGSETVGYFTKYTGDNAIGNSSIYEDGTTLFLPTIVKQSGLGNSKAVVTDGTGNTVSATIGTGLSLVGGVLTATGTGTGSIGGAGTINYVPKFSGTSSIGNSNIQDSGSLITLGSDSIISNGSLEVSKNDRANGALLRLTNSFNGSGWIAGDVIGSLEFYSSDTSAVGTRGAIKSISESGSTNSSATGLSFETYVGATLSQKMYLSSNGNLGIGTTVLSRTSLSVSKNITGSTIGYGILSDGIIQSDVTSQGYYFASVANTAAASFTLGTIFHYRAIQGTFGAGSSVTAQAGFWVDSSLIGATNNYGFFGAIPAGTGRWNLFMNGTANNFFAGNLGIGASPNITSSGSILTTTLTNGGSGYVDGTYIDVAATNISSNGGFALFTIVVSGGVVTTATLTWGGVLYRVGDTLTVSNTLLGGTGSGLIITVATADVSQLTIANSTGADISLYRNDSSLNPNDNVGSIKFYSDDSTTKASGIQAQISAFGAGTSGGAYLSFFTSTGAGGALTEQVRIGNGGQVGIGTGSLTGYNLRVSKNITGAVSSYGVQSNGTIQSDVTTSASYFNTFSSTAAASFTLPTLNHYIATQGTYGVGSAVTSQSGFIVDATLIGATNNYGFRGVIPAGTNRWNLYMDGTANNYMAGNLAIGSTSVLSSFLNIAAGTTAKAQINLAASTAPTSPVNGDIWFDGTNLKIRVGGVTKTVTIV